MTASFWVILVAVLAYGILHSWLASLRLKARLKMKFGEIAERFYRLVYNLIAVLTLLPVLILPVALVDRQIYTIPFPWLLLTSIGQFFAVVILLAGVRQTGILRFLGVCQLVRCEGETQPSLVVTGLYRWVRHPLYSAGLIFIWLMPVMSWNLFALNIGITLYIVVGAWIEERKLLVEFGAQYEAYRQRTAMLIPGLRGRWSY
jgi:methanethiol S-methyltransferase